MDDPFLKLYGETPKKVDKVPGKKLQVPVVVTNAQGDIGIELEIEARGIPSVANFPLITPQTGVRWTEHNDGSLRGEAKEFVLSGPCKAAEAPAMINGLYELFRQSEMRWNLSNRCSTHVHVNMGGKKINTLTSIFALWGTFEDVLIEWCGAERTNNHFCLPMSESRLNVQAWNQLLSRGRMELSDGAKYSALNLKSLFGLGTFEFRTMRASESPEPIVDWVNLVYGFCKYAEDRFQNPQELASAISEVGGTNLLLEIMREGGVSFNGIDHMLAIRNIDDRAFNGFRLVQEVVLGYPWHEWMGDINSPYIPDPFVKKGFDKGPVGSWFNIAGAAPRAPAPRFRREVVEAAPAEGLDVVPFRFPDNFRPAPVDPDQPIEFANGVPAELIGSSARAITARAIIPLMDTTGRRRLDGEYQYDRATGYWSGDNNVAAIRNVEAPRFQAQAEANVRLAEAVRRLDANTLIRPAREDERDDF